MVLEAIIAPILIAIFGGLAYAGLASYKSVNKDEEEFNSRKFFMSIPKAIIGAVIALALAAIGGQTISVDSVVAVFGIFMIGVGSVAVLSNVAGIGQFFGNKDAQKEVPA